MNNWDRNRFGISMNPNFIDFQGEFIPNALLIFENNYNNLFNMLVRFSKQSRISFNGIDPSLQRDE